ncbi:MAG: GNAT family N-acetyltransferase [Bacillota bacterium]
MESFPGVTDGHLTIRPLADTPDDVGHLARWLSDTRVLAHYEGRDNPHDEAKVRHVFYETLPEHEVPCIVEFDGTPLGYLQFYPLDPESLTAYGYAETALVFGIDQFIGEPEWWNRGLGTRMVRLMLAYLFEMEGAERVVVDPVAGNSRALRMYEKCGFRRVRILPAHEQHEGVWQDGWLMEVTPESVRPVTTPFSVRW